ncbi:Hypothetical protein ABZS17D1_00961 [Kosakonia cowanii]
MDNSVVKIKSAITRLANDLMECRYFNTAPIQDNSLKN